MALAPLRRLNIPDGHPMIKNRFRKSHLSNSKHSNRNHGRVARCHEPEGHLSKAPTVVAPDEL